MHTWRVDQRQFHVGWPGCHGQPRFSTLDHLARQLRSYPLMNQSNRVAERPNQLQCPPVIQYLAKPTIYLNQISKNKHDASMPNTIFDERFLIAAVVSRTVNLLWTNIRPINSSSCAILINADCHLCVKIKLHPSALKKMKLIFFLENSLSNSHLKLWLGCLGCLVDRLQISKLQLLDWAIKMLDPDGMARRNRFRCRWTLFKLDSFQCLKNCLNELSLALTGITNTLKSGRSLNTTPIIMAQLCIHACDLLNTVESIASKAGIAHTFVCVVICGQTISVQPTAVFDIARLRNGFAAVQTIALIPFWASTILNVLLVVPQANSIVGTQCRTTISSHHTAVQAKMNTNEMLNDWPVMIMNLYGKMPTYASEVPFRS